MFERNYFKENAVCPKCGTASPSPKYVPRDRRTYDIFYNFWLEGERDICRFPDLKLISNPPPSLALIEPDRVDCLCRCGYQWSEKPNVPTCNVVPCPRCGIGQDTDGDCALCGKFRSKK